MSKQFIVDRHTTPGTPAMDPVATAKVPIYDTLADVTADLANLAVGQIVATKDTGDELAQPVNVVEEGNLHAVSSHAVAEKLKYEKFDLSFSVAGNAYVDKTITFTEQAKNTDYFISAFIGVAGDKFVVSNIFNITKNGFTIRTRNNSSSTEGCALRIVVLFIN